MNIEVLYFDGCPNHEALLPRLRELLTSAGVDTAVELRRVEDGEAAERERFLGSPTVRINGEDVDLSASERTDFGLKCRLATPEGLRGMPADECVLAALERAREGALGLQRSRSPDAELPLPEGGLTSPGLARGQSPGCSVRIAARPAT